MSIFKTYLLERGFHIIIKKCFVLIPNRCEISQSNPSLGPSILADTRSPFQSMWDLTLTSQKKKKKKLNLLPLHIAPLEPKRT